MTCLHMSRSSARVLSLLSLAALATGCGMGNRPSPRMAVAPPTAVAPVADKATVVFMRPSGYAGVIIPSLFADGQYLGDVEATTKLTVTLAPGKHDLLLGPLDYTDACRRMDADLEAGKIYFVEATVANGAVMFAVRHSDTEKMRPWLAVPSRQVDASKLAAAPVDAAQRAECQQDAQKRWADWSGEDRAKSTLAAGDGFTALP